MGGWPSPGGWLGADIANNQGHAPFPYSISNYPNVIYPGTHLRLVQHRIRTEGDSFIVAFADPASAVAFATACQVRAAASIPPWQVVRSCRLLAPRQQLGRTGHLTLTEPHPASSYAHTLQPTHPPTTHLIPSHAQPQLALLKAPWPEELLCHPDAAPVVVDPLDADNRDAAQRVGLPSGPDRPLAPAAPGSSFLARLAAPALYLSSRVRVAAARSQAAREWAAQGGAPSGRWWVGPHPSGMGQVVPIGGVGGVATPGGTILPPPYSLHASAVPGVIVGGVGGGGVPMYDWAGDVSVRGGSGYGNSNSPGPNGGAAATPFGTAAATALYGGSVTGAAAAAVFRPGGGRVHSEAHLAARMHMTGGHGPQHVPMGAAMVPGMGVGGVLGATAFNGNAAVNAGMSLPGSSLGSFTAGSGAGAPGAAGPPGMGVGAMGMVGGGRLPSVSAGKGAAGASRFRQAPVTAAATITADSNTPGGGAGGGGSGSLSGGAPVVAGEGDGANGANGGGVEDLERVSGDGHVSQDCGSGTTGTTAVTATTVPDGAARGASNFGGGSLEGGTASADGMNAALGVLSVKKVAELPAGSASGGGTAAEGRSDSFLAMMKMGGSPLPMGGGKVSGNGLPKAAVSNSSFLPSGDTHNRLSNPGVAVRGESITAAAMRLQSASAGGFMPGGAATPPPAAAQAVPSMSSAGGIFGEWRWSRNGSTGTGLGMANGMGPIPSFFGRRAPGEAQSTPLPFFWGGGNATPGGGPTAPGAATTSGAAAVPATASSWWEAELQRVFPVVSPEAVPGSLRSGYPLKVRRSAIRL